MTIHQNSNESNSGFPTQFGSLDKPSRSLVELTNQLAPKSENDVSVQAGNPPRKPEVVFIEQTEEKKFSQIIEIKIDANTMAIGESGLEEISIPSEQNLQIPLAVQREQEFSDQSERRFSVDPFDHEVDGAMPIMPSLPIVDAQELTDRVVARQSSGDHYAWRLIAEPVSADADAVDGAEQSDLNVPHEDPNSPWTETEVVAQGDNDSSGDCFYAKPGQVISIDGNQGFDHIDLRSYSIDAATFQPGSIVLRSDDDKENAVVGEPLSTPISIRHRGIQFAIFKGEVRVEL